MDRNDIIALPHESLRQRSKKVKATDKETKELADKMMAATLDWEDNRQHEFGVALAAVQVNELKRIVVVRNNFEDKNDRSFIVLVNPQIIRKEGRMVEETEGCLSVKDIYGMVPRYEKVKIKAQDLNGDEFRMKADGFLARVLQHEIDHTNGTLFVDHLKGKDKFYHIGADGKLTKIPAAELKKHDHIWED